MSRHAYRVRVRSRVDGRVLFHVSEREARLLCAEDSEGNPLDGMESVADRLTRKKAAFTDVQLKTLARDEKPSPCTLTKSDMEKNGMAAVNPDLRKPGRFSDGSLNPLKLGNGVDVSASKVEEWPFAHDTRNVVISAGKAHGVITAELPERYLNFA